MLLGLFYLMAFNGPAKPATEAIALTIDIPRIDARPYHRPYVAVWLEDADRKGVKTLLVWHEQEEWLKDLRKWWRSLGRDGKPPYDGVSGATPKPGDFKFRWEVRDPNGSPIKPGAYTLHFEVARENGGREYLSQEVQLGHAKTQTYTLQGEVEIGKISIAIQ